MSSSKPFKSCEYCGRVCEFRVPSSAVVDSQQNFVIDVYNELKQGHLGTITKMAMMKAASTLKEDFDPMSMD
ncbi:MAG: hypothetical protein GF364_22285, partial [Candidatus Lokiarchaeota archaeon]|nr:hypothetical protein [Candidatus Lokiarchaeota archaeon]